ncbi:MAG: hypothetical protein ACKVQK_01950 [Burkholderiales bacterium]
MIFSSKSSSIKKALATGLTTLAFVGATPAVAIDITGAGATFP